jgi:hypothetical protein
VAITGDQCGVSQAGLGHDDPVEGSAQAPF